MWCMNEWSNVRSGSVVETSLLECFHRVAADCLVLYVDLATGFSQSSERDLGVFGMGLSCWQS